MRMSATPMRSIRKRAVRALVGAGRLSLAALMLAIALPSGALGLTNGGEGVADTRPAGAGLDSLTALAPTAASTPGPLVIDYSATFRSSTPARLKAASREVHQSKRIVVG